MGAILRNRGIATLTLGHLMVDSYVGVLPVLYPVLIGTFHLNLSTVALVSLAYSGTASISQPLFGALADRWGTRFTGASLIWTAATFAAVGFAGSFPLLVLIAAASGLGSGMFHPLGAVAVRRLLPARRSNTAMSLYVTGGTVGVATGPLVGVILFGAFGIHGTAPLLLPGLLIGLFVIFAMRSSGTGAASRHASRQERAPAIAMLPLAATIGVMASRSVTTSTLQVFTPTWYAQMGYPAWFYGTLITTLILASALGTVGTGSLADRLGRRNVILWALVLSIPAVALYVLLPGPLGFVWALGVGALAASTGPLTLMMAQELMRGRAGLASGLIMGLAFVAAAIGAPVTGALADAIGLQRALLLQIGVIIVTIPVALLLPSDASLHEGAVQAAGEAT